MHCPELHLLPPPPPGKTGWPWTAESHAWWKDDFAADWPRISIVMPSFNTAEYLEAAIRSVLLQGYPNLDFIIIDGGSNDDSLNIIEKYSGWLTDWVSEPDDGQYHAILKGFLKTNGNIMGWLNSDDMLFPEGLSKVGSIFSQFRGQVEWITGIPFYWDIAGRLTSPCKTIPHSQTLLRYGGHDGFAIQWIMQEGTFWTRSLWNKSGATIRTDLSYAGDFELWLRFARFSKLYSIESFIGGNRRHSDQKTQKNPNDYSHEVNLLLMTSPYLRLIHRILLLQVIRLPIRFYLQYFRRSQKIKYDPDLQIWCLI